MQLRVLFSNQVISMGCNQVVNISGNFFMSFCISSMACILNQSGETPYQAFQIFYLISMVLQYVWLQVHRRVLNHSGPQDESALTRYINLELNRASSSYLAYGLCESKRKHILRQDKFLTYHQSVSHLHYFVNFLEEILCFFLYSCGIWSPSAGRNHFKDLHPCGVMEAFHCSLTKKGWSASSLLLFFVSPCFGFFP